MSKSKFLSWLQKLKRQPSSSDQLSPRLEQVYARYRQNAGRSSSSARTAATEQRPQAQCQNGEPLYALTVKYLDAKTGEELYLPHHGYYLAGQQVVLLAPFGTMPGVSPEYDVLRIKMADSDLTIELKYHSSAFDPAQKIKAELKVLSCPEQQTLADFMPYA